MVEFRLVTFEAGGAPPRAGILVNDRVTPIGRGMADPGASDGNAPVTMMDVLRDYDRYMAGIRKHLSAATGSGGTALSAVKLCQPVIGSGKLLIAGINYRDHIDEMWRKRFGRAFDEAELNEMEWVPILQKYPSCIVGPGVPVVRPAGCTKLDWEVELALVIGRRARNVKAADAQRYIAGYTIMMDVTARDLLEWKGYGARFGPNIFRAKCQDTFAPMGPCILPAEFAPMPPSLQMKLWVNGELMQDANTRDMIWNSSTIVETASAVMTLEPGDIISTGSPAGVGYPRDRYLDPGDVVELEIEKIGRFNTKIVQG